MPILKYFALVEYRALPCVCPNRNCVKVIYTALTHNFQDVYI